MADYRGAGDAFVAQVNVNGTGAYLSFVGGQQGDSGHSIALDNLRILYFTGETASPDYLTTTQAFSLTYGGGLQDAFVTKFGPITPTTTGADIYLVGQSLFGVTPDKVGSLNIQYGNLGQGAVASMTLQAVFDPHLTYSEDTSGVVPDRTNQDRLSPGICRAQPIWKVGLYFIRSRI